MSSVIGESPCSPQKIYLSATPNWKLLMLDRMSCLIFYNKGIIINNLLVDFGKDSIISLNLDRSIYTCFVVHQYIAIQALKKHHL